MADDGENSVDNKPADDSKPEKMFTLKKWNAVAMWSWDVECDICAICRVQVMGKLLTKIWWCSLRGELIGTSLKYIIIPADSG